MNIKQSLDDGYLHKFTLKRNNFYIILEVNLKKQNAHFSTLFGSSLVRKIEILFPLIIV